MDYTLIPTDTEETQEGQSRRALEADSWRISWSFYAAIVGVIITTVNLVFLNVRISHSPRPPPPAMIRGSNYVGLDQLIRNESSVDWPRSRYDFPDYLGIIDTRIPEKIQPSSHRVLLDSTHQAFAHFTVRDFGLQSCALSSSFPDQSHPANQNSTNSQGGELNIWLLNNRDSARNLNWPKKWDRMPSRSKFLGTLNTNRTHDETPFFHCPSGSAQLFAIECRTESCTLDFQQVRSSGAKLGFWMLQSEVKTQF